MNWDNDSGPFCRHWDDPNECDIRCATCGHPCPLHEWSGDSCGECNCPKWVEPEDTNTEKQDDQLARNKLN